jgi:hypothetical protein
MKTKPSNQVLHIPSALGFRCFFGKDAYLLFVLERDGLKAFLPKKLHP